MAEHHRRSQEGSKLERLCCTVAPINKAWLEGKAKAAGTNASAYLDKILEAYRVRELKTR